MPQHGQPRHPQGPSKFGPYGTFDRHPYPHVERAEHTPAFRPIIKQFPAFRAYLSLDNTMFSKDIIMSKSKKRVSSDKPWQRGGWTSEEKYKEYHKEYYEKRKESINSRRRSDTVSKWIFRTARRAKEKGIEWNLSREFLRTLVVPVCPILGIELCYSNSVLADNSPTIDRINNNLGYIEGNVQVLSCIANRMKSNATPEQLLKFADYINQRYGNSQGDKSPPD